MGIDYSKLAEPFDPATDTEWFIGVKTKDGTKGLAIPFINNRAVQDRLDEVCGPMNWKNEYKPLKEVDVYSRDGENLGKKFGYLCGISVYDDQKHEWITKWDGSDETDIEALKGGLSSAMKRAAVHFGIGRYLYKLESPWVEIEQFGRSYRIKPNQEFILPAWALPGGRGYPLAGESRAVTIRIQGAQQNAPQQANQQQPAQRGSISEKQVQRAYAKAAAAGTDWEMVISWITKKFGKDQVEALTRQEYDALCEALDNSAK